MELGSRSLPLTLEHQGIWLAQPTDHSAAERQLDPFLRLESTADGSAFHITRRIAQGHHVPNKQIELKQAYGTTG